MLKNVVGLSLMLMLVLPASATEVVAHQITIEKMFFNSGFTANPGHRGEVWIKVNRPIYEINPQCGQDNWYNVNGYLVAAYADDTYARQNIAGLLAAKSAGVTIRVTIDDAKKNVSGICTLTSYEIE